jgi:hypothetical protein
LPASLAVLLAKTSRGVYIGASIDLNNNLYVGAINPRGTFTATKLLLTNVNLLYVGAAVLNGPQNGRLLHESD